MDTKSYNIEELLALCPQRSRITAKSTNVVCTGNIHLASFTTEKEAEDCAAQLLTKSRKRKRSNESSKRYNTPDKSKDHYQKNRG